MKKSDVLALLAENKDSFISGEAISRDFGVTRAAVWKAIRALRDEGYKIESVTNKGYRLVGMKESLEDLPAYLAGHPWQDKVRILDCVDSTNVCLKKLAHEGEAEGASVLAACQTGGRGRMGRSFDSHEGKGMFLSLLLRPSVQPAKLMHLTAMAAVAVSRAIESVSGARPRIKWTNDLLLGGKKLCGILTELEVEGETARVSHVVLGVGVNVLQQPEDFGGELSKLATSLKIETGRDISIARLAAACLWELKEAYEGLESRRAEYLAEYAQHCVTIGKDVRIIRGGPERLAYCEGIDENAALIVSYEDGRRETIDSGEVSVRGLHGYAD